MNKKRKTIAISIPTGIGLEIGGFAGDFGYIAREFSKYFDIVINPNAINGGILSAINENMYYCEGFALDSFLCGKTNLKKPKTQNKIGVIFDSAIPKNILNIHLNTINAMKTVCGMDILEPVMTKEDVGVDFYINKETKTSNGSLLNPKTLLEAGKKLIEMGADALAIVCFFGDYEEEDDINYTLCQGIDPIGGVEAVISHFLVRELNVPCAHAPAFSGIEISEKKENPKVSSELISSTYLPCVIKGLEYAPKFVKQGGLNVSDISGFIVPQGALGSVGVLGAFQNKVPLYTVQNNSQLNVGCLELGIKAKMEFENYFDCLNYLKETLL